MDSPLLPPMLRSRSRLLGLSCIAVVAAAGAMIPGCSTLGYYWQAFDGQRALVSAARPIPDVLQDPATAEPVKVKLDKVRQIRDFASRELGLPDNGSYRRYADLKRPYVVWNVFATSELSVEPREWCFPVAGCVGYRGYFAEERARRFGDELRAQRMDVYVGGVPAYSTLGWLDDPVLNTFIGLPETELARLIFHELAHQVVYAKGDSTFNESFAVTVESEGVKRWIDRHGTPAQRAAFITAQQRRQAFVELVQGYRERLAALYGSDATAQSKREQKARIFDAMREDYARLKESWDGYSGYDWWFAQPLNNAQLASVAIYTQLVPGFDQLLADNGGDLVRFYAAVKKLSALTEAQRWASLQASR
jgi:predicted aminopeptidase